MRYWKLVLEQAWAMLGEWTGGVPRPLLLVLLAALSLLPAAQKAASLPLGIPWTAAIDAWSIHAEQERRIAALEAARAPKLTIEFDPDDPTCVMRIRNLEPYSTLYRIRVRNKTDAPVTGVRVELTEFEPPVFSYLPASLLFMNESPETREITLNPRLRPLYRYHVSTRACPDDRGGVEIRRSATRRRYTPCRLVERA